MPFKQEKSRFSVQGTDTLTIGDIPVRLEFKQIRHIYLRIRRGGEVQVSLPLKFMGRKGVTSNGERIVCDLVNSKLNWIESRRKMIESSPPTEGILNPDTLRFRGRKLNLIIESRPHQPVYDEGNDRLTLGLPHPSPSLIHSAVEKWQRQELRKKILPLAQKWEMKIGVQAREYRIRRMTTRWGTCNPFAKRIWISLALIEKPDICLEYILVHELVHLLERSHNHRFRALMDRYLPQWREHRRLLGK